MYSKIDDEHFILEFVDYRYEFLSAVTTKKDMNRATPHIRMLMAHKVYNKKTELFEKERFMGKENANDLLDFANRSIM